MAARTRFTEVASVIMALGVCIATLVAFGPGLIETQANDGNTTTADEAYARPADTNPDLQVVTLDNWNYTAHEPGHFCPPGLAEKGPGHPGFDKHCSPVGG